MATYQQTSGGELATPKILGLARVRFFQLVLAALILIAWEVVGQRVGSFILAPPTDLITAFVDIAGSGELIRALWDSLYGLALGYSAAAICGVAIGLLMGWYPRVAFVLNPFVSALYVVPVTALVPLLIVWLGIGAAPRIVTVALFAVFEILLTTYTGVRDADQRLVEMARSFGATPRQLFAKVILFDALPIIFTGLRIGAGRAIKGMVVAELIFAVTGLGGLVLSYSSRFQTARIMVVVIVVSLLGVFLVGLVQLLERKLAPWYHERSG